MSFSNLFDSGFKKRNEDHFAAIVRVAMSDGIINDEEKAFLNKGPKFMMRMRLEDDEFETEMEKMVVKRMFKEREDEIKAVDEEDGREKGGEGRWARPPP